MVKFIFEDSEESPSSKLLKSCYDGADIYFSGGGNAEKIQRVIDNCLEEDKECKIIVFFDLPPNNRSVYVNYEALLARLLENYTNVYVIPIMCIEFYLLKFLLDYRYIILTEEQQELTENLIFNFDYKNSHVQEFINKNAYRINSLEHAYKELLRELVNKSKCMLNKQEAQSNTFHGKFYVEDCSCDKKFCKIDCRDNLGLKAERFYSELPIFILKDKEHKKLFSTFQIDYEQVSLDTLFDDICTQFTLICESMEIDAPLIMRYTMDNSTPAVMRCCENRSCQKMEIF